METSCLIASLFCLRSSKVVHVQRLVTAVTDLPGNRKRGNLSNVAARGKSFAAQLNPSPQNVDLAMFRLTNNW